ncbi:hypothetical protein JCM14469_34970 [Desulfatiferula olefinivorans]
MNRTASIIAVMFVWMLGSAPLCPAENSFERELVVKDQTRSMKVESVFKELIKAYEDEDARSFLDRVSDERFRQDYITFTDALYNDFRTYDIHRVDYWIDRIVPDNVKHFLYVKWEKRYESLDTGRQNTGQGYSRFLFDEVNGKYLLVEMAGNSLFGGSLREWNDELPRIPGAVASAPSPDGSPCAPGSLGGCTAADCALNGGYWYDNRCNATPQAGGLPDLRIVDLSYSVLSPDNYQINYSVSNIGTAPTTMTTYLIWPSDSGPPGSEEIPVLAAGQTYTQEVLSSYAPLQGGTAEIDSDRQIEESNEDNNTFKILPF